MKRLTSWVFLGLLVVLFFEILVGFPLSLESNEETQQVKQDIANMGGAEHKMGGVHFVESREGNRDWELFAEKAEGNKDKGAWELNNVKVLFYDQDQVQFTVTGERGSIDNTSKNMNIEGNVQTLSSNGYRFQTTKAVYSSKDRLLVSPEKVKMYSPPDRKGKSMSLVGDHMETIIDESRMVIHENVRATKPLDTGKDIKIQSKGAEFSSKSNMARFYEQVSIELESMKLEGPEAGFFYDGDSNFLQSVSLKGGVRMSDFDKFATSENLKFEPAENKLILSGKPRVVQNNDEILGDKIIFIDGGKKIKVENIKARMED